MPDMQPQQLNIPPQYAEQEPADFGPGSAPVDTAAFQAKQPDVQQAPPAPEAKTPMWRQLVMAALNGMRGAANAHNWGQALGGGVAGQQNFEQQQIENKRADAQQDLQFRFASLQDAKMAAELTKRMTDNMHWDDDMKQRQRELAATMTRFYTGRGQRVTPHPKNADTIATVLATNGGVAGPYTYDDPENVYEVTPGENGDWAVYNDVAKMVNASQTREDTYNSMTPGAKMQWASVVMGQLHKMTPEQLQQSIALYQKQPSPKADVLEVMQHQLGLAQAGAKPKQPKPQAGGSMAPTGSNDIKDAASMIASGQAPPVLTEYSFRDRTKLAAELHRQGYNLAQAEQDWKAVQKTLASMNGAQQIRLRQALSFASDTIPQVQQAYADWKATGLPGGFKQFNRAALNTAAQLPGDAGSKAKNLQALIADFTSELGTVYKGGNSSTDESLKLAAQNLSADWNDQTFNDAVKRIDQSLKIRRNSMNLPAAGVSSGSQYQVPGNKQTQQAPARPAGVPANAQWNPQGNGGKGSWQIQ